MCCDKTILTKNICAVIRPYPSRICAGKGTILTKNMCWDSTILANNLVPIPSVQLCPKQNLIPTVINIKISLKANEIFSVNPIY